MSNTYMINYMSSMTIYCPDGKKHKEQYIPIHDVAELYKYILIKSTPITEYDADVRKYMHDDPMLDKLNGVCIEFNLPLNNQFNICIIGKIINVASNCGTEIDEYILQNLPPSCSGSEDEFQNTVWRFVEYSDCAKNKMATRKSAEVDRLFWRFKLIAIIAIIVITTIKIMKLEKLD